MRAFIASFYRNPAESNKITTSIKSYQTSKFLNILGAIQKLINNFLTKIFAFAMNLCKRKFKNFELFSC